MAKEDHAAAPPSRRFGLILTATLAVLAGVVSYLGVRDSWVIAAREPQVERFAVAAADEPEIPPGKHRALFQASCTICHSTRLVFSQPPFPREKWAEIVHKMAAAYGAPLAGEDEGRIVAYLAGLDGSRGESPISRRSGGPSHKPDA